MAKDIIKTRQRFARYVRRKWRQNNHDLKDISCVYAMLSFDVYGTNIIDIDYVGSSVKLNSRYKSHKVPDRIRNEGKISIMYFLPMSKGFYDYEIKLIKSLKPKYNTQHKNG
jgi:hypothetical protein